MNDDPGKTPTPPELRTDWERLRGMSDEDAERAAASDTDALPTDEAFWTGATIVPPQREATVTMRLDADLLDWFRQERGYQSRINSILRDWMNAHREAG